MKWKVKNILLITLLLLLFLAFFNGDLLLYGLRQGRGQLRVLLQSKPVEEVIEDPLFPDSLKSKLRLVREIKRYATDELGMAGSDNYETVYDQKGQPILWNVSGCEPFSFSSYKWWFPLLGNVSYKGFFNLDLARQEAEKLKELGYDVRIREVGAWSTLGWFRDPIMSGMLTRPEEQLAETIFHELTHTTIFLPDSVAFNETLASFVAQQATFEFLHDKYGFDSPPVNNYATQLKDEIAYYQHFLRAKDRLEDLYETFEPGTDTSYMQQEKEALIRQALLSYDTIQFINKKYQNRWKDNPLPNNAFFMYFARYYETPTILYSLFAASDHDVKRFLESLKELNN